MGLAEWLALLGLVLTLFAQWGGIVWFIGRQFSRRDTHHAEAMTALRELLRTEQAEAGERLAASITAHAHEHGAAVLRVQTEQRATDRRVDELRLDIERRFAAYPSREEFVDLLKPIVSRLDAQSNVLGAVRDAMVANGLIGPKQRRGHHPALLEDNGT